MRVKLSAVLAAAALVVTIFGPGVQAKVKDTGPGTTACDGGTVTWSPNRMWPPNHKVRDVTISFNTTTEGDALSLSVDSVTNSEDPQSGSGAKHEPDVTGVPASDTGTATQDPATVTIGLRAERDGRNKDGRTYTINVTCSSVSGGGVPSTAQLTVTVPHDQGKRHNNH